MTEPFSKVTTISDEYKYSNILINWPSNIIGYCGNKIYIYLFLFCLLCGIQKYWDISLIWFGITIFFLNLNHKIFS